MSAPARTAGPSSSGISSGFQAEEMSATARTAEAGPKDEGREPRGTLGAAPLTKKKDWRKPIPLPERSGGRGIRTPGALPHNSFQDCRHRPLGQPSIISRKVRNYSRIRKAKMRFGDKLKNTYFCSPISGELSEWLKEPASKTGVRVSVPGVRIPHSPQKASASAGAFRVGEGL